MLCIHIFYSTLVCACYASIWLFGCVVFSKKWLLIHVWGPDVLQIMPPTLHKHKQPNFPFIIIQSVPQDLEFIPTIWEFDCIQWLHMFCLHTVITLPFFRVKKNGKLKKKPKKIKKKSPCHFLQLWFVSILSTPCYFSFNDLSYCLIVMKMPKELFEGQQRGEESVKAEMNITQWKEHSQRPSFTMDSFKTLQQLP